MRGGSGEGLRDEQAAVSPRLQMVAGRVGKGPRVRHGVRRRPRAGHCRVGAPRPGHVHAPARAQTMQAAPTHSGRSTWAGIVARGGHRAGFRPSLAAEPAPLSFCWKHNPLGTAAGCACERRLPLPTTRCPSDGKVTPCGGQTQPAFAPALCSQHAGAPALRVIPAVAQVLAYHVVDGRRHLRKHVIKVRVVLLMKQARRGHKLHLLLLGPSGSR